jgi:hypothetical protein
MAYPASQLIAYSWYLSGIVSRGGYETVTGDQESDGLFLLNELLNIKFSQDRLIPYWTYTEMNLIVGQEMYFIEGLATIEEATFNIDTVRYSMLPLQRRQYFGTGRVDNINALPFSYHLERCYNGSNLYIYFLPYQEMVLKFNGKYALLNVTLGQDLSLTLDGFYLAYLRYALAEYMCSNYNIAMPPLALAKLNELEEIIKDVSPFDLTITKLSSLQEDQGLNWADVNIGHGWRP